ncbi:phage tail tube protein [Pseudomonas resinovorans]|uniref:Phage tail tube protein n=1 Tax=Metapseudomonas resinovorans TaxID=53412 RepID=A0ABT4Y496_METRE|nr:phage tail tube protein [Pseudomonas resinovorans]MDA8483591.1 phage tail tube protein [Pseudomonas resinovorans]
MPQFAGRAKIRVDGKEYRTLDGATINTGGVTREAKKGYEVYGFTETVAEPTVECKIPLGVDDSLLEINRIKDATVEFVTDIGKTFMIVGAWCSAPCSLSGGDVDVKFAGLECKEV